MADALSCFTRKSRAWMRPAYKQHVREFVKGGRAALANHSLDESLRLKDTRNRPSVDPNCELFPQGPIIPVPPNTPPYRPVGACGNNRAVSPGRHTKRKHPNQRVRRLLFPLFRWWLCPAAMPKQYQAVLGSTKTRVQKPVSVVPTRWLKTASSLFQSILFTLSLKKCPRIHGIKSGSRFFGSPGPFSWVTLGHGKLRSATYGAHGRYIPREGKAEKPLQTLS